MKVLVACEFSGRVRDAFIAKGHDAVSCDILMTITPGPHIQSDVRDVIREENWDLMIAHPDCTYLCIILIMLLCYHPVMPGAQESAPHVGIITIKDLPESIIPASLAVKKGDTIVWYNQGKEPISIRLIPQLGIVCSPIVNFYSDLSGNYKTGSIYHGGTASLCFLYTGVYEYEIKWIDQKKKTASGKVMSGSVKVEE